MKRTIGVFVGDALRRVGTLRFDSQGARQSAAFEYGSEWLAASDGFALAPALPLITGAQFHKPASRESSIFHGAIADTEPDGWARRVILRDHAKRRAAARAAGQTWDHRPLNSIDFLLAVDDISRVGALRLQDEDGIFQRARDEAQRTAAPLIELSMLVRASRAVETNTETARDLAYLRGRGTSLGGLRPKCSVIDEQGALSIGKFPSVTDERAVTKGEVLAMQLAKAAGISVPSARLIDSDGVAVTLIQRFDRPVGGRLMYISAATLLDVESEPAEHSYTEIVDAIRQHGSDPPGDITELWRRIAFYILINNVDDHLRNHGFIHVAKGRWRLSPAFDINPFPDRERELKTWISEDAGPAASIDALMAVAPYFGLAKNDALQTLAQVERAVATWHTRARELGMSPAELEQFADAFEHREREVAKTILR
jgi:serine/threonine-protein kinase HipA